MSPQENFASAEEEPGESEKEFKSNKEEEFIEENNPTNEEKELTTAPEWMTLERTVKYSTLPYDWYESNGNHIFTIEMNVVSIEDSNDVSVEAIDGEMIRIESL